MFDSYYYNVLANQGNHLPSRQYYCQKCITWSDISGRSFAARYCNNGAVFDVKGSCGFPSEDNYWLAIAFLNSKLTPKYIDSLNPTTTTQVGDLKRMPVIEPTQEEKMAIETSAKNVLKFQKIYMILLKFHGTSSTILCFVKFRPLPKPLTSGRLNVITVSISWKPMRKNWTVSSSTFTVYRMS